MPVVANIPIDEMGNYWVCTTGALEPVFNGPQVKQIVQAAPLGVIAPQKENRESRVGGDEMTRTVWKEAASQSQASFANQESSPSWPLFSSLTVDFCLFLSFFLFPPPIHTGRFLVIL